MNQNDRKQLDEAYNLLERAEEIVSGIRDGEQDKYDNMPENMQGGDKGQAMEESVSALDDCLTSIEEARTKIEEAKGE